MKLKDFVSSTVDNRGRNPEKYYEIEQYPVIDNYLIKNFIYPDMSTINRYIDQNTFDHFLRGYVHKNMPIMTLVGNGIGNVTLVPSDDVAIIQNTIGFECNDKIDEVFLYYYLLYRQEFIRKFDRGSGQPSIRKTDLLDMEVNIPNISKQKRIREVLFSIDEKIENNNVINNNLEQQAQALFKKWFIDNPENVDWSAGTFRELIQSTLNGDWGKKTPTGNNTEKVYCIRGADIPEVKAGNKGKMPTRYILPKNLANKKLEAGDLVVEISGGSPTQSTGRCTAITQSLLDRYDSSMVCTNFCKAIKPKNGYSLFVYYYWQYLYEKGVFFSYENGTTGIKNLDFTGFIETESIIVPPFDKVQVFDDYCKSIFSQIFANGKQSEQLASLRDALLPKLMSGELDISDIDL